MSRHSILAMRACRETEASLPLRGYFLSVGGALLCLLWAAGAILPAPSPGRLTEPDPARPPIRIHSAMKGPELVVIDTNQSLPAPSAKEIVLAHAAAQAIDRPDRD
ncbi:hypothetical protein [Bradyrhizobium sp. Gha]|uniref:hypothetical protein n=1 Tax=Bradyrhizobium sp. Gha TaxID=1855318 RepID=UPI0008E7529B|nr:hypothetical protein [Bradyrhizobium sp. Gha]SFJ44837.1 hypothetical protein SAMN05216525_12566 [Bradyrhizobium sp. Gha]